MCASPLRFLRAGPPPPKVVLLSDALFFTRAVRITAGATPTEAAAQAELALESASPFPLAQLYYGSFWRPGSEQALVFAAYRRRFTSEQIATWAGAELALPAFAAVLGADVKPATTLLLTAPESLTAVHWDEGPVPAKILVQVLAAEAADEDRIRAREELLREIGGSRKVIEVGMPVADESDSDREVRFHAGDLVSRFPDATAAALDVRDKGELAALRGARKRDVILWRVALGAAAALLLLGLGELGLVAGREWQKGRARQYAVNKPLVDKISSVHELTHRIDDLATKRLLPLEMMGQIVGADLERKPADIDFTRFVADQKNGLYTIFVSGKTNNPAQVNAYELLLKNLPSVQSAEAKINQVVGDRATFDLTIVFKPATLKPTVTAAASSQ